MSAAVYLDHAATTPVDPRVAAAMSRCLTADGVFGNPGSTAHDYGEAAGNLVETARLQVARAVGAEAADVIFTSGATEADNLAILGAAEYYRGAGRHVVTARTEHEAVLDTCRELERRGFEVTYLKPDRRGAIGVDQVEAALRSDTVLVSLMHVNNETGVIADIEAVAAACARRGVRLHVDAAQSVGKLALGFTRAGIDYLALSAHKAYGPKGVGALLVSRRRGAQLKPLQFGGGQERGLRSGTVPTHQVVGMGLAFEIAAASTAADVQRLTVLRDRLWAGLEALGGALRNGAPELCVPHVLNVSFEGVEGESLLAAVSPFIAVSRGSACASAHGEPSYVLRALGRSDQLAQSSLRFSLGTPSTQQHVDAAIAAVGRALRHLRKLGGA